MEGYRQAGGMITGIIAGKDMNGTTSEYLTSKFKRTGATGKRPIIGRSNRPGVSRAWNLERDHNRRLERSNQNLRQNRNPGRSSHGNPDRNPGRYSHSTHRHNTGRHRSNRNLDRENLNAGGKKNRTEIRTEIRIESRIESRMVKRMA
jgi:hypothetical protein